MPSVGTMNPKLLRSGGNEKLAPIKPRERVKTRLILLLRSKVSRENLLGSGPIKGIPKAGLA